MAKRIVRLQFAERENLYRFSSELTRSGYPVSIEHFEKSPEARQILGRWLTCPNFGVACRIKKLIDAERVTV